MAWPSFDTRESMTLSLCFAQKGHFTALGLPTGSHQNCPNVSGRGRLHKERAQPVVGAHREVGWEWGCGLYSGPVHEVFQLDSDRLSIDRLTLVMVRAHES
jgi:hypothetical protein